MKKILFAILSSISFLNGHAQFVPVPSTFNTPMGPIHTTHYVYMPSHYYGGNYVPKFRYTAKLQSDSMVNTKSKMLADNKKMYIEYKNDKKKWMKLFPADTKDIIGFNALGAPVHGIPVDSCWLFVNKTAAIKCYSSFPSTDISTTIAVQKGDDQIISLTKENLREMVSDVSDEKIAKWIEKGNLVKVIERYNQLAVDKK